MFGLSDELDLLYDNRYNNALVIFFIPYILLEIPSNMLLKKLKPRIWLSICMLGFGLVTMLQGFVQSYSGLLATRFFLGVFETGMFPGAFYLIGMWYRRQEAQKRYSFFFSSTTLAGAFGGLLASAIGKMDGVRGYKGWRWICKYPSAHNYTAADMSSYPGRPAHCRRVLFLPLPAAQLPRRIQVAH